MSFFIRKRSKNSENLSQSLTAEKNGISKPRSRNSDVKFSKNRQFGGKNDSVNRKRKGGKANNFVHKNLVDKRPKFDKNEEIESSSDSEDGDDNEEKKKTKQDSDGEENEEFFSAEDDIEESAQEKKVRLAKLYLEEIEKEEKDRRDNEEVDTDLIATRLKEDVLEQEGRLRKELADSVVPDLTNITVLACPKYLTTSVTCLCISEDEQWIYSGCKRGHLIKWNVQDKKKVAMVKRKESLTKKKKKQGVQIKNVNENSCHSSAILSIAISSDGKYLATGDMEKQIAIWDPESLKRVHIFSGHRGPIRGLVFRKKTHMLYSCSNDRSIRIWSLDEMGFVETLFGHQDAVTCIDALGRERAISGGGRDNSIRVWKIVEESQLVYNGHYNGSIDCVKLINEENFLSGGEDGLLCSWNVNRKKPLFTVEKPHGCQPSLSFQNDTSVKVESEEHPRWISSLASWTNSDLVASGSSDGFIRFWKCGERFKSLSEAFKVPCPGWINSMEFSSGGSGKNKKFLAVGIGKEHKLGRWFENIKGARDSIMLIPLNCSSS